MKKVVVLFVSMLLNSSPGQASGALCADLFQGQEPATLGDRLKQNPRLKAEWEWLQNRRLNQRLKASSNKAFFEKFFTRAHAGEEILQSEKLHGEKKIVLVDRGLRHSMDVVLSDGKTEKKLFSNFDLDLSGNFRINEISVSPLKRWLVISTFAQGSIDEYRLIVYNLLTRTIVRDDLKSAGSRIGWVSNDSFLFSDHPSGVAWEFRANRPRETMRRWEKFYGRSQGWTLTWRSHLSGGGYSFLHPDGRSFDIDGKDHFFANLGSVVYDSGGSEIWTVTEDSLERNVIKVIRKDQFGRTEVRQLPKPFGYSWNYEAVWSVKSDPLIEGYWGAKRFLMVPSYSVDQALQMEVPDGTRVEDASWSVAKKIARISLSSAVNGKRDFDYNFESKNFRDVKSGKEMTANEVKKKMLNAGGTQFSTKVIWAPAEDGTRIPIRLTYRSGTKPDGQHGLLLDVYGGFAMPGLIYGQFDPMNSEFMKRGGILAAPAVRGGNEFGPDWHKAAALDRKEVTVDDLIVVARHLVSANYTTADKIIARGTSLGATIVAAAGLKSPESFGLAISINGLHNLLGKDHLDADHDGFSDEFGNAESEKGNLGRYSPVVLATAATQIPRFLIIGGPKDSRVNPVHSLELSAALLRNKNIDPSKVSLATIRNAGHWQENVSYQGVIGWRTQVIMWTNIFDHLGFAP